MAGLSEQDLIDHFFPVLRLGDRLFRCARKTPSATTHYYVRLAGGGSGDRDLLLVSRDRVDDAFAGLVMASLTAAAGPAGLRVVPLPANRYGFTSAVLAPADYHSHFAGILDEQRMGLTLCLPAHACEFSGDESPGELAEMCLRTVPVLDWGRVVTPKIELRFHNPRTGGGTGETAVLASRKLLSREADLLNGVGGGFLEIRNWRHRILEVLSPAPGQYTVIRDRDDRTREPASRQVLEERIGSFLVTDS
jgi:hypothetical protein